MNASRNIWTLTLGILSQSQGKIIYVPTEAGLPILEAGKRGDDGQ